MMRKFFTLAFACLFFLPTLTMAQFPAPYCAETFPSNVEPITSVVFSNINNTSSPTVGGTAHENFTSIVGNVLMGSSYTISVQGNTDGSFTTYVRVFIDWNNNGSFTDPGESYDVGTIVNSTGTDGVTASTSITIPNTATAGNLRMRVSKRFSTYPAPCNNAGYGQAEDYTLNVVPPTPCSGAPVAGTAISTSTNITCAGTPFTLSLSGAVIASGLTYQWQSSTDNVTWNPITGATSSSYTLTQSLPTVYYRAVVTCSGQSTNSGSVMVTAASGPAYTTLPYTESFENAWMNGCNTRDIPNGFWKNTPNTGAASWRRNDDGAAAGWTTPGNGAYTPAASVGSFSARFHSYQAANGTRGQFDLYFNGNTAAALKQLSFDFINTTGNDSLVILLSTDGGTTFSRLDSAKLAAVWRTKTLTFSTTSATSVLRFDAYSDAGSTDIGLDNIMLITFADCVGTPTAGTASSSLGNVCTESFTLKVSNDVSTGNGISYQWQRSIDNGATWTNIPGATALTYTTTQVQTTQYRLMVACSFSATSSSSVPVVVTSPPAAFGVYSIDNSTATNVPARTFNNFNDAYNFIKCGISDAVVFNVKNNTAVGPYVEQLIMTAVPGTSVTKTVTFKGDGLATIKFNATNANERAVIKLRATKFIVFDSLRIDAAGGTYGYGVQLINTTGGQGADSNVVRNCTILLSTTSTTQNFAGIVVNGTDAGPIATGTTLSDYNTFDRNTIIGGYYGITLVATLSGGANLGNVISNNNISDFYNYGIYVSGTGNTLIEGNTIHRPTRTTVTEFQGIYFTNTSLNSTVARNRIKNPFGAALSSTANFYGINFSSVAPSAGNDNYVINNAIYKVNGNGAEYGIANTGSSNVSYFHNTIALDSAGATSSSTSRGFYQTGTAGGIDFYNNLVYITRGGSGAKHAIYLAGSLLRGADYNDYYVNTTNAFVGYYSANRAALSDWRTATSLDATSISINPAFIDAANENYAPGNAGMDNKGLYIGIDNDIENNVRSQTTPDIGAFEFTPPPCSTPPVNGTAKLGGNNLCQNTPVLLSMQIGPYGSAQTFQWQTSRTLNGPYTNLGSAMVTADTTILADTSLYFRVAISCGSTTIYSDTVLLTVIPALPGGTYTIDNVATTYTGPGTGTAFKTFNDAKAAMSCGILGAVVFNVVPNSGPYNEQLVLDSIKGTSPVKTVTFKGNGNTIAFSATNSNERAVVKLRTTDYVIFDSLTIEATGTVYGYAVQLVNRADSNVFRNCTIKSSVTTTSSNFAGIVINASETNATTTGNTLSDDNLFDRNTIIGGYYGITLVGGTTAATYINNNKFTNNTITDFYSTGMQVTGTAGTQILNNTFTRPTTTVTPGVVNGILVQTAASSSLNINANRFYNMFGGAGATVAAFYGIYHNSVDASAGSDNIVSNNLIYNINNNGAINALYNVGSDNVKYLHNTIALDHASSTASGQTAAFNQNTLATGLQFKNNLITIRRGGNGAKYGIYMSTNTSEVESDNNDVYIQNAGGTANYFGYFTGVRATLADWRTATNKDANSVEINPLYLDTVAGNYMPGSLALDNKGTFAGIATDILGVARPTDPTLPARPDIGAYEFVPPPCVNPPVAGTAIVTPNSGICLETPIHLTLTGNSPVGALTFQWQSATSATGPWTNVGPLLYDPTYDTLATTDTYYRALVTCNGTTTISAVAQVTLGNIMPAGSYTISSAPTNYVGQTGANFNNFNDAVNAMLCGIGGKIVINVAAGTYTEQVRVPYVRGTSSARTVTFQSANGVASSVNLTFDATTAAANYTLKLDSARNFIFRDLTISGVNATYGRVVEFASNASFDSLLNCKVVAPVTTTNTANIAGVFSSGFKGTNIVIKGNTITNGSYGIYFSGTGLGNNLTTDHVVDSNFVSGFFNHGIYEAYNKRAMITRNQVDLVNGSAGIAYGIYLHECDSAYTVTGNKVSMNNTTGTMYGFYINNSDTSLTQRGLIANNKVTGTGTNTGSAYGMYINNSPGHRAVNNIISLNNTGALAWGLYTNSTMTEYFNNSIHLTSTSAVNGYAAYFLTSATSNMTIRNNIFSNAGGGRAMFVSNTSQSLASDYNMLYASGATLVQRGSPAASYANLQAWRNAALWDANSIVYQPAFVSDTDLQPNLGNPDVWAMHGRGVQIPTNSFDYYNQFRPTTLTSGVPDLGAIEFFPTALPTVLTPTPATPAANQTQVFMYGTDTVMKVTWGATVPPSATARRYSGVVPQNLPAGMDSMYFYTKLESPAGGNFPLTVEQFYIDPWQGSIPDQNQIGLGKTNPSNNWIVGFSSRVDSRRKLIRETNLTYFDKFTGLVNPYAPPVLPDQDSSNRGRRFWVAYPINELAAGTTQQMVLYLSAFEAANVQVKINGTSWVRNYSVAANSVAVTEYLPKAGPDNAYISLPGTSDRGISITSDVPIVAYAHVIGSTSSGASMLMPVGVWGYEYRMLGITQSWGTGGYSYFYVVADNDNTKVEITTPAGIALQNGGVTPGTPFTVTLNKGQVYQVIASGTTTELSGSFIKSVPNAQGKCYPIASFSGSSRTYIDQPCSGGGDFIMQQNFPSTAWGKRYLTAPSSLSTAANSLTTNLFRVAVKDPTTIVKRNGVVMSGLQRNFFYEFTSGTADYIEADKPIMVAQYLSGACSGVGDPEMIYLSPIEQGIKKVGFYRNTEESITVNYLTLIIPTNGLPSFQIFDGNTLVSPDYVYPHPQNSTLNVNYSVVVKRWTSAKQQVRVESDSAFTAITYGLGSVESYGYNAGTLVKTLFANVNISNTGTNNAVAEYNCVGTPFRFRAWLPLKPVTMTWKFSATPNLSPSADSVISNPVPYDSTMINGNMFYAYTIQQNFVFSAPGLYPVQLNYAHPDIESCDKTVQNVLYVQVVPSPKTNFAINFSGCEGGTAQFTGETITSNGINVNNWSWTFHDNTTATGQTASFTYPTAGTYNVRLHTVTPDGCIGDSIKPVVVNPLPVVAVVSDSIVVCSGSDTAFNVASPLTGATYNWYTTATGGTPVATGVRLPLTNVTTRTEYYVEGISAAGCTSAARKRVVLEVFQALPQAVPTFTSSTGTTVTFSWPAVTGAAGYQVSIDGGATFITPSSGATGLTHTVSNLGTLQQVCIVVKVLGASSCQNSVSTSVCGCTNSAATVVQNTAAVCNNTPATFTIQNPVAGITYTWWTAATGGTQLASGTSFTTPAVSGTTSYYVQQSSAAGCVSSTRTQVTVTMLAPLAAPVATVSSATLNSVTFSWNAVPGATAYQVSTDNGTNYITPSSGATGLTHTITGLTPLQQVSLIVRAVGNIACQNSISTVVTGRALGDQIFIPNTFTPNNDGRNDFLEVFGDAVREVKFLVFNQWGEKLSEVTGTARAANGGIRVWDGVYKGKVQPAGVYIYTCRLTLIDGTVVDKKGSINLVK